jgi:hypothetical protein
MGRKTRRRRMSSVESGPTGHSVGPRAAPPVISAIAPSAHRRLIFHPSPHEANHE